MSSFFFKQKTAYEIRLSLVGSEMCIRDRSYQLPEDSLTKLAQQEVKSERSKELEHRAWIGTRTSFALLRSALVCIRGSRTRRVPCDIKNVDIDVEVVEGAIKSDY